MYLAAANTRRNILAGTSFPIEQLKEMPNGHITIDALYRYVYSQVHADNSQEPMHWDLSRKGEHLIIAWRRPEIRPAAPTQVAVQAYIAAIVQRFQQGEVIPFVGPGVIEHHAGARPPVFAELARQLAQRAKLQLAEDLPLTLVSQTIHMRDDRDRLYRHVKSMHRQPSTVFTPALTHHFLGQIRQPLLILSASYDTLLEDTFDTYEKPYVVVTHLLHSDRHRGKVAVKCSTQRDRVKILPPDELQLDLTRCTVIYKIHGAFDLVDAEGEEIDSLVISEEDYVALLVLLEHPQTTIPNNVGK